MGGRVETCGGHTLSTETLDTTATEHYRSAAHRLQLYQLECYLRRHPEATLEDCAKAIRVNRRGIYRFVRELGREDLIRTATSQRDAVVGWLREHAGEPILPVRIAAALNISDTSVRKHLKAMGIRASVTYAKPGDGPTRLAEQERPAWERASRQEFQRNLDTLAREYESLQERWLGVGYGDPWLLGEIEIKREELCEALSAPIYVARGAKWQYRCLRTGQRRRYAELVREKKR